MMKITELVKYRDVVNEKVELFCFLALREKKGILTDDLECQTTANSIDISHIDLWGILNGSIAPFGGGAWDVYDTCKICLDFTVEQGQVYINSFSKFTVIRNQVEYIFEPSNDIKKIKTNVLECIQSYKKDSLVELTGYFSLVNEQANLSDAEKLTNSVHNIRVAIDDIEEIVEENFVPDNEWPDYHALVKVNGVLHKPSDGICELTSVKSWEVIYDWVSIRF